MARSLPRMTMPTKAVLRSFLVDPEAERYGLELAESVHLPTGTIHPILARLETHGWVQSRWEDVDPHLAGRPPRRYYRLTADGVALAKLAVAPPPIRRAGRPTLIVRSP